MNEVFYSLQGEGHRAGTPNVFVRFSGCNLTCSADGEAGFDCDTEFTSGTNLETGGLVEAALATLPDEMQENRAAIGVIFTGGEPALQLDEALVSAFRKEGFGVLAVETNGTVEFKPSLSVIYVACSPKTAEHTLKVQRVDELRYVRRAGQAIPRPRLLATHHFISPAWDADGLRQENLAWCIDLVRYNPGWRLSLQQHKLWRVR